jgi:hypothetical protein
VRRWLAVGAVAGLVAGIVWVVLGAVASPLRVTCEPAIPVDVCADTTDAGLRRGMPRLHPLIAEAHVEPGPVFPDGYGHRASVSYSLVPGPTVVERLFFDAGGHWGAIPDYGDLELAAWSVLPLVLAISIGAAIGAVLDLLVARGRAGP